MTNHPEQQFHETFSAEGSIEESRRLGPLVRSRAAKVGLVATRLHGRQVKPGAPTGFCLLDQTGSCIAGEGYSMTADEVINFCERIP